MKLSEKIDFAYISEKSIFSCVCRGVIASLFLEK